MPDIGGAQHPSPTPQRQAGVVPFVRGGAAPAALRRLSLGENQPPLNWSGLSDALQAAPLPGSLSSIAGNDGRSPFATPGFNPGVTPESARDIVVVVWGSDYLKGSVGHVFVGDPHGRALLSQFPAQHGTHGVNTVKSWQQTVAAEKRPPDAIYRVKIDDPAQFALSANASRRAPAWDWMPGSPSETNCTVAAYQALNAGGARITEPRLRPWTPNDFHDAMNARVRQQPIVRVDNKIKPTFMVPWSNGPETF